MTRLLDDVQPGQPITAQWANELLAELRRLRRAAPAAGVQLLSSEAGTQLAASPAPLLWLFVVDSPTPAGTTSDDVRYYDAHRAHLNSSGEYAEQTGLGRRIYDPTGAFVPRTGSGQIDLVYAAFNRETERWEIVGPKSRPAWAVAYENWTKDGGSTPYAHFVRCHPIETLGGGTVGGESLTIYLPGFAKNGPLTPAVQAGHPNIVAGDVIAYECSASGELVCVSAYMDEPIGTVRLLAQAGSAPPGWGLMNGTANSGANGGSGLDLQSRFVRASGGAGATGGAATHTHADHPAGDTGNESTHTHSQNQATVEVQAGAGTTVVASAAFDTDAGTAHHHPLAALSHASANHLPPYTELQAMERLDNSA